MINTCLTREIRYFLLIYVSKIKYYSIFIYKLFNSFIL